MARHEVAVITGAASGIGAALAFRLARAGMQVVLADVDQRGLQQVVAQITSHGGTALALLLDVTDAAAVQATIEQWQRIVALNLMGVIHGVHAAYPVMLRQRSGHIIYTASISGLIPVPAKRCTTPPIMPLWACPIRCAPKRRATACG